MPDLDRFHKAQEDSYAKALAELKAGRKTSHWIWFTLPQLASLGRSATARYYGIADLDEARAYLADPVLHGRLLACADAILLHEDQSVEAILGPVDALKTWSCATLFRAADPGGPIGLRMQAILDRYYDGMACPLTLAEISG